MLIGARGQQSRDFFYDASGTIATGGTAQLVLAESKSRSSLILENISDTAMYFEFGSARATATLTNGAVSSVSITNAGFGFTFPPIVTFLGGGTQGNSTMLSVGQPGYPAPSQPATAQCVLSGGAVSAINVNYGGSGYSVAPLVFIQNSLLDPYGCAIPSATSGILLAANGGSFYANGTACSTDPIAVYCATTGKAFTVKYLG